MDTNHAVILAAGLGSRLGAREGHKLLVTIAGRSLLARHVDNFRRLGVTEIIVVTGYEARGLRARIEEFEAPSGLRIRCAHNRAFRGPNGLSVLAGADAIAEDGRVPPFWLTMSDHLFEPAIFDKIAARFPALRRPQWEGALFIDRKLESIYDMPDATKLRLTDGDFAIGKELDHFDAIDVGLFWCTQGFVQELRSERAASGRCTTSDAVRRLHSRDAFGFPDIVDGLWQDVDTPGARTHAEGLASKWD